MREGGESGVLNYLVEGSCKQTHYQVEWFRANYDNSKQFSGICPINQLAGKLLKSQSEAFRKFAHRISVPLLVARSL